MEKFLQEDKALFKLLSGNVDGLPGLIISGEQGQPGSFAKSDTHGGFDNDPNTMNSILIRILGKLPVQAFTERDLQF